MDSDLKLHMLLNGDWTSNEPQRIGRVPKGVIRTLGWRSRDVFLTQPDAQKIRHHSAHGMDQQKYMKLPTVIRHGDFYQSGKRGTIFQIEVVLHEDDPRRAFFLVLARDKIDKGLFIRTFYYTSALSRSKMKSAQIIYKQSTIKYFK